MWVLGEVFFILKMLNGRSPAVTKKASVAFSALMAALVYCSWCCELRK
jgi:hypothetical protein